MPVKHKFLDLQNSFTAIDFETAALHHICAVGIITVEKGEIIDEYYSLIQPPNNTYNWYNVQVHGINPEDTMDSPTFKELYPEIKKRLLGRTIIAHNESFDRNMLKKTMAENSIDYSDLKINDRWECTMQIYRTKGYESARLDFCCKKQRIQLKHHEALSDARVCAMLYLKQ